MIKKILCFVFAIVMVLSFFGCATSNDNKEENIGVKKRGYYFAYPLINVKTPSNVEMTFDRKSSFISCYIDIFYFDEDYYDSNKEYAALDIIDNIKLKFDSCFELQVVENHIQYNEEEECFILYSKPPKDFTIYSKFYLSYELPEFTIRKTQ